MAHELGHLLFTARHPKIAHDLDVIKKHIKEGFSVSPEEEKRLEEMEEKCNEFAGRLLISKKYAGEVWDL